MAEFLTALIVAFYPSDPGVQGDPSPIVPQGHGRVGIYLTSHALTKRDVIEDLFEARKAGKIDAVVINVKNMHGELTYDSAVPLAAQIGLAHEHSLPLVIHTREAWDDTFAILDAEGMPERTVFHCFTGGPAEAEAALERGGLLSFSGIVTFANADDVRAALALAPIERIMVETDSPYLAPVPNRGKRNAPAYLPFVGQRVADVLEVEVAMLAAQLWTTTHIFYGLPD